MLSYDGRRFRPVVNSANGQVNGETTFHYRQSGATLTATYAGGGIRQGAMLGLVAEDGGLRFSYHHIGDNGELRSGACESRPELLEDGRIRLHERWLWTLGGEGHGESVVEEIPLEDNTARNG